MPSVDAEAVRRRLRQIRQRPNRPEKIGLGAIVMVGVVLDRSTPESFADFRGRNHQDPVVLDCNLVAGISTTWDEPFILHSTGVGLYKND